MLAGDCTGALVRAGDGNTKRALAKARPNQYFSSVSMAFLLKDQGLMLCRFPFVRRRPHHAFRQYPRAFTSFKVIPHRTEVSRWPISRLRDPVVACE